MFSIIKYQKNYLLSYQNDIGYCNFSIYPNHLFINYIWVEHHRRHSGIGLQMLIYLYNTYNKSIHGEFMSPGGIKLYQNFIDSINSKTEL